MCSRLLYMSRALLEHTRHWYRVPSRITMLWATGQGWHDSRSHYNRSLARHRESNLDFGSEVLNENEAKWKRNNIINTVACGYSDDATAFWSRKEPSDTKNLWIEWRSLMETFLPIRKCVTETADYCTDWILWELNLEPKQDWLRAWL